MNTHGQILLDHRHTTATALRGAARVNLNTHATSFFRFVAGVRYQLVPRGIGNAFRQAMILDHACDRQVFKHNRAERIYQFATDLVREILSSVCYAFVNTSNCLAAFGAFRCPFFFLAQFPLRSCQVFLITTEEPRIGDGFTSRKGGKCLKTDIDTDRCIRHILWLFTLTDPMRSFSFAPSTEKQTNHFPVANGAA